MKRIVAGWDDYKWGHRAIARFGTSGGAAADALFTVNAPRDAHTVSVGPVYGVAIAPDSEVRSVEILPKNGARLPLHEGEPLRARYRLDDCNTLRIDALEAHDGCLVLLAAETPEECALLPTTETLHSRSAWMQYNSATAQLRAFALPPFGNITTNAAAQLTTLEARDFSTYVSGGIVSSGTSVNGDHTIEFSAVELKLDPPYVGGGRIVPTQVYQPVSEFGSFSITPPINAVEDYFKGMDCPVGPRGVVVAVTTASTEPNSAARTLHRIQINRTK